MTLRHSVNTVEKISVQDFYDSFHKKLQLEQIIPEANLSKKIREKSINRPALALTGYMKYFAHKRLQLFGAGEMGFLKDLSEGMQERVLIEVANKNIPCIVVSRNLVPTKSMIKVATTFKIPLFRTKLKSKDFSAEATILLEDKMAPWTKIHGTLLDVKGIGALIRGKSDIGKSECALALINRGYSLVSDDVVNVKLVSDRDLVGTSPELSRGYMETRGIGIINIADLFGVGAVRLEKRIDIDICFVEWVPGMNEERVGIDESTTKILGLDIPHMEIPVRPGRDMARLVEVATMVQALKFMGHNSAEDFNDNLIKEMA